MAEIYNSIESNINFYITIYVEEYFNWYNLICFRKSYAFDIQISFVIHYNFISYNTHIVQFSYHSLVT